MSDADVYGFDASQGHFLVSALVRTIHDNRDYLSQIDGAIGDGDHGINMDKGFSMAERAFADAKPRVGEALITLGRLLIEEIGGSMGPLYGTFFKRMGIACRAATTIDAQVLEAMLASGYEGVKDIGGAQVGDKTLVDTLDPALEALRAARAGNESFPEVVDAMMRGAEEGCRSTENLVAKIGRASRLGERSRGVLDAGATSCRLLIEALGQVLKTADR